MKYSFGGEQVTFFLNYYKFFKKLLRYIFIVVLTISMPISIVYTMELEKITKNDNLFLYSKKDISRFLKRIGYPDYAGTVNTFYDITRNSYGTNLRLFDWYNKKCLIIKCDGSIFELNIPGRPAWFNDENEAVAWVKGRKVYYKNGETDNPPFRATGADLGGNYFVKGEGLVKIFSIENPKKPLAEVNLSGSGALRIFSKGDKVYLFDYMSAKKSDKRHPLKAYVFQKIGTSLKILKEVKIPYLSSSSRPYVVDLSPWRDVVLICERFDWPFKSKLYEFNIETNEIKKIGVAKEWAFYLQCDLIKKKEE